MEERAIAASQDTTLSPIASRATATLTAPIAKFATRLRLSVSVKRMWLGSIVIAVGRVLSIYRLQIQTVVPNVTVPAKPPNVSALVT